MTVYDHHYKTWKGRQTPRRMRFLVPLRYALMDLFSSKLFLNLFAACFIPPLIFGAMIYFHHNANVLEFFKLEPKNLLPINLFFFYIFLHWQSLGAYLLTLLVGPLLLSSDCDNNALPLYLVRPFSQAEYLLSKAMVLIVVLSLVTWVPGLLLLGLQTYYVEAAWTWDHIHLYPAIFGSFVMLILVLTCSSVGFGVMFKTRTNVGLALLATPVVASIFAFFIMIISRGSFGYIFNVLGMLRMVWRDMFGMADYMGNVTTSWVGLTVLCIGFVVVALRKLKAFEVVS